MGSSKFGVAAALVIGMALSVFACSDARTVPTPTSPSVPATPPSQPAPPNPSVTYTLSGVVSGPTSQGLAPLSGAAVDVGVCPPYVNAGPAAHVQTVTDAAGNYRVAGACAGTNFVWVSIPGYKTAPARQCDGDCLYATVNGDTRFDIDLVSQ